MERCFEIDEGKLDFRTVKDMSKPPRGAREGSDEFWFEMSEQLVYTAFFADFGPLDIGKMYLFCSKLDAVVKENKDRNRKVVFFCSNHAHTEANSVVLILAYQIFCMNRSAEVAYKPFMSCEPPITSFRDAAFCLNTCPLTVLDCACALRRVADMNHFDMKTFDLARYEYLSKLQHGDVSWIIPGKFIAFSGPLAKRRQLSDGVTSMTPAEYIPLFKGLGVTCVIRFNNKCYDRTVFTSAGIHHADLFYEDGGNPTQAIMQRFIEICEGEKGAIAVHCKAGLGRTGTNIGAYMMKHYNYSAREATAWCRICRPGSVVGPQQQFLASVEEQMFREGQAWRASNGLGLFWQASAKGGSVESAMSRGRNRQVKTGGASNSSSAPSRGGSDSSGYNGTLRRLGGMSVSGSGTGSTRPLTSGHGRRMVRSSSSTKSLSGSTRPTSQSSSRR